MIITKSEIEEVERLLDEIDRFNRIIDDPDSDEQELVSPQEPVFFANRPHLLLPLGFDEYRAIEFDETTREPVEPVTVPYVSDPGFAFAYESFFRETKSGVWQWFEGITDYKKSGDKTIRHANKKYVHFIGPRDGHYWREVTDWLKQLRELVENPDPNSHMLLLPSIWTPRIQLEQRSALEKAIPAVVKALHLEQKRLQDIPWRQLEELVAELLRSNGLEIFLTKRTRDGGRDILARGELIPGEPTYLAVEVKQKAVVGIEDVQRALWANRHFPSLMIATAGTFSGGVIQERVQEDSQLRLILKDGLALSQWIDAYAARNQW